MGAGLIMGAGIIASAALHLYDNSGERPNIRELFKKRLRELDDYDE